MTKSKPPGNKGKSSNRSGARDLTVKVKTAKGRKLSSTKWLQRQLNDPYVTAAKRDGYRSRAAYKLIEIDDKFHLLQSGFCVVDLGCAPGGWSQVAAKRVKSVDELGKVIGIDLTQVDPIPGVELIQDDFMSSEAPETIISVLNGKKADLVMSDMAAASTGHKQTDHLRIMGLCEAALEFSLEILEEGGGFLAKVLQGGTENDLLNSMKYHFKTVRHVKPKASRSDSSELYVFAKGFRK